ncbi:DUF1476 domain-containing protein [Polycladidibacter stylochi]|uniref:DUF1476 domain-containing protein n=1 Tax=Polycladidibacter stylochi TaxID=1807766 RepID=UPI0008338CDD|nr:DUF1476 domain-containing protein [Pseudovibrio stylochi]
MGLLEDRENAFEGEFALNADQLFKVKARRNKLIAQWAGEMMECNEEEIAAYAVKLVGFDLVENGDELVVEDIKAAFADKDVEQSEHQIRRTMQEMFATARLEVEAEL